MSNEKLTQVNDLSLSRRWRRKPLAPSETGDVRPRWTRLSLAENWRCSERKVDRMRKAGLLGEPIGRIGKTDIYSDDQKLAAERAGLEQQEPAA
jgi:hypothetical protein